MNHSKGLFKNIASLGIVQIANYALPLISLPIISRIIGPEKFGILNYSIAFIAYFNLLIGYGFDLSATRKVSKYPGNLDLRISVFNEVFFAKLFLFSVSIVLFTCCLYLVHPLAQEKQVATFTFLVCIGTLFTQNWLFQAMQDLPKVALLNFFSKLIFTISILIFIRQKEDYILQPLIVGLIQITIALFSFIWAFKKYKLKFQFVKLKRIISLLIEEKTIFFSMLVINLYTTTNTVMLGFMQSDNQVGYYTAAQKLMAVVTSVINIPLAQALYPFIGMAFSEGLEKGLITVQKFFPLVVAFTLSSSLIMFFMGPTVINWFYGDKFGPSVHAFRVISFIPVTVAVSNMLGVQVMLNLKMDKLFFRITAGGALLGLCLNYYMINVLGFIGTAWNWLIVELYISITMYLVLRIKGIHPIDFKQFRISSIITHISLLKNQNTTRA